MEKRPKLIELINFSAFGITPEEVQWLEKARPAEINLFLTGTESAQLLRTSVRQDIESRHISGYAGLHEYKLS